MPQLFLPNGTILHINDALLSTRQKKNLLNFRDVRQNEYHLETINVNNKACHYITYYKMRIRIIHEKLEASNLGLYCVLIRVIESYAIMSWRLVNPDKFGLWHDCLCHPGVL